jgi:hypothetical protein
MQACGARYHMRIEIDFFDYLLQTFFTYMNINTYFLGEEWILYKKRRATG